MSTIVYQSGYKYQLVNDYTINLMLWTSLESCAVDERYIRLDGGELTVRAGYAWDGPSGPTIDTRNFMRGSLVHDALYQLIREDHLPRSAREDADKILRELCREDGMSWIRAWWVYRAVRGFAGKAALPSRRKPIQRAP